MQLYPFAVWSIFSYATTNIVKFPGGLFIMSKNRKGSLVLDFSTWRSFPISQILLYALIPLFIYVGLNIYIYSIFIESPSYLPAAARYRYSQAGFTPKAPKYCMMALCEVWWLISLEIDNAIRMTQIRLHIISNHFWIHTLNVSLVIESKAAFSMLYG